MMVVYKGTYPLSYRPSGPSPMDKTEHITKTNARERERERERERHNKSIAYSHTKIHTEVDIEK